MSAISQNALKYLTLLILLGISPALKGSSAPRDKYPTFQEQKEERQTLIASDDKYEKTLPHLPGQLLQVLPPSVKGAKVHVVAFSPDSRFLATGDNADTLRLWNTNRWKTFRDLKPKPSSTPKKYTMESVTTKYGLAFAPNGKTVIGASGFEAQVWDVRTGQFIRSLVKKKHKLFLCNWDVACSQNGQYIATSDIMRDVVVWNAQSGRRRLNLHLPRMVMSTSFSPDSKSLAIGLDDFSVQIRDIATARITRTFKVPLEKTLVEVLGAYAVYSPDGKVLASISDNQHISLWDLRTGMKLRSFQGPRYMKGLSFSPDGRLLVAGSLHGYLGVWDSRSGKILQLSRVHDLGVNSTAFSPDGQFIATCSNDGTTKIWENRFQARKPMRP